MSHQCQQLRIHATNYLRLIDGSNRRSRPSTFHLTVTPTRSPSDRYSFSVHVKAQVETSQTYQIPKVGKLKLSLDSKQLFGVAQSRGERPYQEDCTTISSLKIPRKELKKSLDGIFKTEILDQINSDDHTTTNTTDEIEQALFVGVFDGHGGSEAAEYLKTHLPNLIEDCEATEIPNVIRSYRDLGGYFRRFRGGYLEDLGQRMYAMEHTPSERYEQMETGERLTLAFLEADQHLISSFPKSGAVGTVALIQPLPSSSYTDTIYPFYSSPMISLTIAHIGDTVGLLCSSESGKVLTITETHHPDSRIESERLRRIGTGLITDSFGESRWGGTLANTRGLGDSNFKKIGVTGEPDILKKVLKGEEWAFLVIVSDGVSDVMSNQEIVDLCRDQTNPTQAAERIIDFAEQLGGRDNMTALIVPFAGWGKIGGTDLTADRRDFRLRQVSNQSGRQRRM